MLCKEEGEIDAMEGEGEYYGGEDDWYYAASQYAQADVDRIPSKISEEVGFSTVIMLISSTHKLPYR